MKTEAEIKKEIEKQEKFIESIDCKYDLVASLERADSRSWIEALKWVLEEE